VNKDFANSKRKAAKAGKTRQANASTLAAARKESAPWVWFVSGLLCGVFLSALSWLAFQAPDASKLAEEQDAGSPTPATSDPGPRFDFYTLLPEQTIRLDTDSTAAKPTPESRSEDQYLLQAGSFKQPEDADRRRGELLLLGLDAHVEEAEGDNGRWYRVYIGPFQSRSKLAKARSLTAQQGIDTLLLRRPRPGRG
jgi:cell division septation protein DedD